MIIAPNLPLLLYFIWIYCSFSQYHLASSLASEHTLLYILILFLWIMLMWYERTDLHTIPCSHSILYSVFFSSEYSICMYICKHMRIFLLLFDIYTILHGYSSSKVSRFTHFSRLPLCLPCYTIMRERLSSW